MKEGLDRRRFLAWCSTAGVAVLAAPGTLSAGPEEISTRVIREAERISGLTFTPEERKLMEQGVRDHRANFEKLREISVENSVPPALRFSPVLPGRTIEGEEGPIRPSRPRLKSIPTSADELPFLTVTELGSLLRRGRITSVELTDLYLERLARYDEKLACVITLTTERARAQAREADRDFARGQDHGPLHGIPWGLKDLFAVRGYPTTWGAAPYKDQRIEEDATIVKKLDAAGAVLVAKLSVGALAWGDVWFGGTTKNPWNLEQGSSGSSAGPAAATAAGLVGFSIGTETLGSIISPAQRCGATGLRPTFGRVSRYGGMTLSWSMDKTGPICRSVEDCALVLDAIRGADGKDAEAIDAPFGWNAGRNPMAIRVGYDPESFEAGEEEDPDRRFDLAALDTLKAMGYELVPVILPELPVGDMLIVLEVEAAAAFDELTRSNRDDLMVRQIEQAWPNVFRAARLVPAVEYVQANRLRTLLMREYDRVFEKVDVYVHATYGGKTLLTTNLTGQPTVVLPNGFREDGTPTSICFTGRLFGEENLCLVAKAYQDRTGFHRRRPTL